MFQMKNVIQLSCLAAVVASLGAASMAGNIAVVGGPTYDGSTLTGYSGGGTSSTTGRGVNDAGEAAGYAHRVVAGVGKGARAVRWDASGTVTELGNLGISGSGATHAYAHDINTAGTAIGYARRHDGGVFKGDRAVRWDASASTAIELDNLGVDGSGVTSSYARGINTAGTVVGRAKKYDSGSYEGFRAVRWDASGTAGTELGHIGDNSSGSTFAGAN